LGTGSLAGICFFELLPEVFQMGGRKSIIVTGVVWIIYSVLHIFHLGHHHHADKKQDEEEQRKSSSLFFLGSMMIHCLASGMLLVLSEKMALKIPENAGHGFGHDITHDFSRTVFFALLAHKIYEALTVSSILFDTQKNKTTFFISISAYALSFPAGVVLTYVLGDLITQGTALFATSVAVGTLLGCLIFDFLWPSFNHLKTKRTDLAWIVLGLLATQAVFFVI
jgi:zinc transporter ZupT